MNINSLKERMQILYASVERRLKKLSPSAETSINVTKWELFTRVRFGSSSPPQLRSDVNAIISDLASLRDIIKVNLRAKGLSPRIMEDAINASFHLQLIVDLNNEYKHGHPLRDGYRSGVEPIVGPLVEGLKVPPGETVDMVVEYASGRVEIDKDFEVVITGDITTRDGRRLCTLDELFDTALTEYEGIMKENGLL